MTCHWWWTWPEEQLIVLNITDGTGPDCKAGDGAPAHWGVGGCKLVCTEPVQLHLTLMMMLARIGKRGMVRTLVGECTASLSWPWGELVCHEPAMTAPALCSLCIGRGCWQDVYGNWSCSVRWLSEDVRCLHGYGWMVGGVMRVTGNAMPFLKPFTVYENGLDKEGLWSVTVDGNTISVDTLCVCVCVKQCGPDWWWMVIPHGNTISVDTHCVCKTVWTRQKHSWCTWSLQDIYKWFLNDFWWWHHFAGYSPCASVIVTVRQCLVISDGNTVLLDLHCVLKS